MKALLICLYLFLFLFILLPQGFAALYINEFSSDTDPDWVEIYNSGPDPINLSAYRLRDNTATNKLNLTGVLETGNFEAFDWSNRLSKNGDIIKLLLISDEINPIDQVGYGNAGSDVSAPLTGQSAGRQPDGSSSWTVFITSTKKSSNNTSSPAPTKTASTPTKTVSSPTSTQKTLSSSPSVGKILSAATSTRINVPTSVLGQSTKSAVSTPSSGTTNSNKEVKTLGSSQNNIFKIFIGVGGIFIIACAILLFQHFKNKENNGE